MVKETQLIAIVALSASCLLTAGCSDGPHTASSGAGEGVLAEEANDRTLDVSDGDREQESPSIHRPPLELCQDFTGAPSIDRAIELDNDIRPIVTSSNTLPGTIKYHPRSRTLTEGFATFKRGGAMLPSSKLRIRGIYEPSGTRAVKLDVSRGSPANYYGSLNQVGENPTMSLVDTSGKPYWAIGFLHTTGPETRLELRPREPFRTPEDLPLLPMAGDDTLALIFYVTEGATIQGFCLGGQAIGRANIAVTPADR